jgi:hypothetical protein
MSRAASAATEYADAPARALVDPLTVARELGVSRGFVYAHADNLGAIRLGSGPKPRIRFDLDEVRRRLTGCSGLAGCSGGRESGSLDASVNATSRRRRSRRLGTSVELLPIRGRLEIPRSLPDGEREV